MNVGDKVIINPNIPDGAYSSRCSCGFHIPAMLKPGVFILGDPEDKGSFYIDGWWYDEEWLLPVPLFDVGDTVKIKDTLKEGDDMPYGVDYNMEKLAGRSFKIELVRSGDRPNTCILGDDGCRYLLENNEDWSWSSPMFDISNYKFKSKSYESRLQEQESPLRGGSREFTSGVCCRKHKPRITVQSVGYKKVIGRG